MLQRNGLHLHKGPDDHALAVIVEAEGRTIWLRNFATFQSALDILEDEILEGYDRDAVEAELTRHNAYLAEIEQREDGYKGHAFKRCVLAFDLEKRSSLMKAGAPQPALGI